ncbi:unnamed protein product [Calypogeia fissa]
MASLIVLPFFISPSSPAHREQNGYHRFFFCVWFCDVGLIMAPVQFLPMGPVDGTAHNCMYDGEGAVAAGDGEGAQHRNIGAYQFGKDDADGARAVLHGPDP